MKKRNGWVKIKNSVFFVFYSLGQKIDDKTYFNKCDKHVKKICKIFSFDINKIKNKKYYILPGQNEYKQILGKLSFGEIKNNCLYSVYSFHPHEITHIVVSRFLGKTTSKLFSEGIAVLYGWNNGEPIWHSQSLDFWFKKHYKSISLKKLLKNFDRIDAVISYPIAGCFVKFIIDIFGVNKFKKLYRQIDSNLFIKQQERIIKKILGTSLNDLEKQFYNYYNLEK